MAEKMKIHIPFGGLDLMTDAANVVPGKMLDVQNVTFRRHGAYITRNGFSRMTNTTHAGGAHETPIRVYGHGDEYLVMGQRKLWSFSPSQLRWEDKGHSCPFLIDKFSVVRTEESLYDWPDEATQGRYSVVGWSSVNQTTGERAIRFSLIDVSESRGVPLVTSTFNDGTGLTVPRTGATLVSTASGGIGGVLAVYDTIPAGGGGQTLRSKFLFLDVPPWALGPEVVEVLNIDGPWDTSNVEGAANQWIRAYRTTAAVSLQVDRMTAVGVSAAANTVALPTLTDAFFMLSCRATTGENTEVVYNDSAAPDVRIWRGDTATLATSPGFPVAISAAGAQARNAGIARMSATRSLAVYQVGTTMFWVDVNPLGVVGTLQGVGAVQMVSRPFVHDGRVCVCAAYDNVRDPHAYIYALTGHDGVEVLSAPVLLGWYSRGNSQTPDWWPVAFPPLFAVGLLPHVVAPTASSFDVPQLVRTKIATPEAEAFATERVGIDRVRIYGTTGATDQRGQAARWGGLLIIAGARPSLYDGQGTYELGFTQTPVTTRPYPVGVGTLDSTPGPYVWANQWEWPDALGLVSRSAQEVTSPTSPGLNTSVFIFPVIPPPGNRGGSPNSVRMAIYRTQAGGVRLTNSEYATPGLGDSDGNGAGESDAGIADNEVSYTDGGVLDAGPVPACKVIVGHAERIFVAGLEDAELILATNKFQLGIAPEFNEARSVRIPGARIGALGSMDTALVAFSDTETFAVFGDGPSPTGGELNWSVQRITGDVGCSNWRSIVTTPNGLMFQSGKGIYMLGRDMSLSRAGEIVDRVLERWDQVVGAVLRAGFPEVMFALRDSTGTEGPAALIYDYSVDQWALHEYAFGDDVLCMAEYTGSDQSSARLIWGEANGGRVMRENDAYLDGELPYGMSWTTPNAYFDGIGGWAAISDLVLMATRKDAHGITVEYNYDNVDDTFTADDTVSWTAAELTAIGTKEQLDLTPPRIKCSSLRTRFTVNPPLTGAEGPVCSGLVIQGRPKPRGRITAAIGAQK